MGVSDDHYQSRVKGIAELEIWTGFFGVSVLPRRDTRQHGQIGNVEGKNTHRLYRRRSKDLLPRMSLTVGLDERTGGILQNLEQRTR